MSFVVKDALPAIEMVLPEDVTARGLVTLNAVFVKRAMRFAFAVSVRI